MAWVLGSSEWRGYVSQFWSTACSDSRPRRYTRRQVGTPPSVPPRSGAVVCPCLIQGDRGMAR